MTVAAEWAATVILVRDHPDGVQAYLQRRAAHLRFAPGAWVFPGGKLDPDDTTTSNPTADDGARDVATPQCWATSAGYEIAATSGPHALGMDRLKALARAAIRETFEECGVLLATDSHGVVAGDLASTLWHQHRRDNTELKTLTQTHTLDLSLELVLPIARWVTPAQSPRRFDTMFFLAPLPAGQAPQLPEGSQEADDGRWMTTPLLTTPQDLSCLPPTWATLDWISRAASVAKLTTTAAQLNPATVLHPIQPAKSKLFGTLAEHQVWNHNGPGPV